MLRSFVFMTFNFEKVCSADVEVHDDIKTLSLNRRNSAPPVLNYDGRGVLLRPGLTLRLAAWVVW